MARPLSDISLKHLSIMSKVKGGIFTRAMMAEKGISSSFLRGWLSNGLIVDLGHTYYRVASAPDDPVLYLSIRYPEAVFSHFTALWLHGVLDKRPERLQMTFLLNTRTSRCRGLPLDATHSIENKYPIGMTMVETRYGHAVNTYDVERSFCDIFMKKGEPDEQLIRQCYASAIAGNMLNRTRLVSYAVDLNGVAQVSRWLRKLEVDDSR